MITTENVEITPKPLQPEIQKMPPETVQSDKAPEGPKLRSFEEAMDYTFANFDNALRKLAQ